MAASVRGTYRGGTRGLSRYITAITGGSGTACQGDQTARRTAAAAVAADTLRDYTVGVGALSDNAA